MGARAQRCRIQCLVALVLWAGCGVAASSEEEIIRGTVTNGSGSVIEGAAVNAIRYSDPTLKPFVEQPQETHLAVTDRNGDFRFKDIQSGYFTLVVSHPSFGSWSSRGFHAGVLTAVLDVELGSRGDIELVSYDMPRDSEYLDHPRILEALEEPPLCEPKLEQGFEHSYRFIWSRTFHRPVSIQLLIGGESKGVVIYKESDGASGYDHGALAEHSRMDFVDALDERDRARAGNFLSWFAESASKLRDEPYKVDNGSLGFDGAVWTAEVFERGRCHVVQRWSPELTEPVRRFGEWLMGHSGKRFYYDEVY
ncbi:hypothetical protein ABI59_13550 [Acidobacteria bacterium Mor1]|nr:hypothetical protein ABI59_13550 [Acidobacteria bacterium Mor1]